MNPYLSPEAQKAMEESRVRQSMWLPTLKRTKDKLVLIHALYNRRGQREAAARVMLTAGWQWDGKRRYFYTSLSQENLKVILQIWTDGRLYLNLSDGVREYQQERGES